MRLTVLSALTLALAAHATATPQAASPPQPGGRDATCCNPQNSFAYKPRATVECCKGRGEIGSYNTAHGVTNVASYCKLFKTDDKTDYLSDMGYCCWNLGQKAQPLTWDWRACFGDREYFPG